MGRRTLGVVMATLALAWGATSASAQAVRVGGQVSLADDADFGLGGRLGFELPSVAAGLWAVGTFDYFFPGDDLFGSGGDVDYWEVNGNFLYDIAIPDAQVTPYFGAGLNIAHASRPVPAMPDDRDSDTKLGLNLIAGLNFDVTGFTPFVEVKIEIDGGEQFIAAGGITFP